MKLGSEPDVRVRIGYDGASHRTAQGARVSATLENTIDNDDYAVFIVDTRIVVLVWKQPPSLAGVTDCRRLFQQVRTKRPGDKFGYLAIVESRAGTNMPADVRDALTLLLREYQGAIAASAIVFEGTGFRASIVRSVVSAINLATRLEFSSTVESDLTVGASWLMDRVKGSKLTATSLVAAVNGFRRRWNPGLTG